MANLSSEERRKKYSTIARKEDIEQSEARKDINLNTKADERRSRYASKDYLEKYNAYHAPTRYDGSAVNRYLNAYGLNQQRQADRMQEYRNRYEQQQFMNAQRDAIRNGVDNGNNPLGLKNLENPLDDMRRLEAYKEAYGKNHKLSYDESQKLEKAYGKYNRQQLEQLKEHFKNAPERDYSGEIAWVNEKLLKTATGKENIQRQNILESQIKDADNRLERLQEAYADRLVGGGTDNADYLDKVNQIKQEKSQLQNELNDYKELTNYSDQDDFAKYKLLGEANPNNPVRFFRTHNDEQANAIFDPTIRNEVDTAHHESTYTGGGSNQSDRALYRAITDEEADNYSYILGKYGQEEADKYLQAVAKHTDVNGSLTALQEAQEQGYKNPLLRTAESIGLGLITPVEAAKNLISGDEFRTYDDYKLAGRQEALRSGAAEKLTGGNEIGTFLYNTATSAADNLLRYAVGGGIGAATGEAGAAEGTMRLMMGGQVMDSAMKNALDRGLSDSQAVTTALISAVNEELFETISLSNLKAMQSVTPKNYRQLAKNIGKQFLGEGSEEMFTDIGNAIADDLVNGEKSEIRQNVLNYMKQGMSEEEAKKQASVDFALQLVESGLSGGITGAAMGGAVAVDQAKSIKANQKYNELFNIYKESGLSEEDAVNTALSEVMNGLQTVRDKEGNVKDYKGLNKSIDKAIASAKTINENVKNIEAEMNGVSPVSEEDIRDNKENIRDNEVNNEYLTDMQRVLSHGDITTDAQAQQFLSDQDEMVAKYPDKKDEIIKATVDVYMNGKNNVEVFDSIVSNVTNTMAKNETSLESKNTTSESISQKEDKPAKVDFKANINGEEAVITSVNKNNMTVRDSVGNETTIPINAAEMSDGASAAVEQAKQYGKRGSRLYLENMAGNIRNYTYTFNDFYNAGKQGKEFYGRNTRGLNTGFLREVYDAGVQDGSKASKTGGLVRNDARYTIQESEARVLDAVGKAFNVTIQMDHMLSHDANGYLSDGVIHISTSAEKPSLVVFSHEFTHRLEDTSPEAYKAYKDYVIDYLKKTSDEEGNNVYETREIDLKNAYARQGVELSDKELQNELVANATESFLSDTDFIEDLVKENKSLAQQILDVLKQMLEDLKNVFAENYDAKSKEGKALQDDLETREEALKLWTNAIKNQNTKAVKKNDTRYSMKDLETNYDNLAKEYEEAVKEDDKELMGDLEADLSDIVEEYAKKKGFDTLVYHGTQDFGFTKIDTNMSDDDLSFFATNKLEVANTYSDAISEESYIRKVSDKSSYRGNYEFYANIDNMYKIDGKGANWNEINIEFEEDTRILNEINAFRELLKKAGLKEQNYFYDDSRSLLDDLKFIMLTDRNYDDDNKELTNSLLKKAKEIDEIKNNWNPEEHLDEYDDPIYLDDYINRLEDKSISYNTREIARIVKNRGYDGVIIKNIYDDGGQAFDAAPEGDVYIFFKPQEQLKSADAVTYDDEGNVIPLSERFNKSNDDIRFSMKEDYGKGGYNGKSMSNRAVRAYEYGEKPLSKWTKAVLLDEIDDILFNNDSGVTVDDFKKLTVKELKDNFLDYASWHHTGALYNTTDFYKLNEDRILDSTKDDIKKIIDNRKNKKAEEEDLKRRKEEQDKIINDYYKSRRPTIEHNSIELPKHEYLRQKGFKLTPFTTKSGKKAYKYIENGVEKSVMDSVMYHVNLNDEPDIKYSLKEDSEGRELSPQQQEYFKNSKVRDADGNLQVLYHQTDADFTVFDPKKKGAGSSDYLTPYGIFMKPGNNNIGLKGNKQMKLYANITNILTVNSRYELEKLLKQNDKIEKGIESIKNIDTEFKEKYDAADKATMDYLKSSSKPGHRTRIEEDPEADRLFKEEQKVLDEWSNAYDVRSAEVKKMVDEYLKSKGYDGVHIIHDEGSFGRRVETFIAFNPNQVKNVDNTTPTDNPDIRFSLKEESNINRNDVAALTGKDPYMAEAVKDLEDIMRMKGGEAFFRANQKELYKIYDEIAEEYNIKDYSKKRFADNVKELFDYIQSVDNPDGVDTTMLAMQIADDMLDKGSIKDTSMEELYPTLQQQLRDYKIKIADQDKADFDGGYNAFRKKYFGSLTLSNDGTEVDSVYEDLASSFPELFPEDITHPGDRLTRIADVADMFRKTVDHIEGATKNESAFIIAQDIINKAVLEQTKNDKSIDNKKRLKAQEKVRKQNTNIKKAKKDIHDDYVKLQNKVKALESINKRLSKNLTKAENELGRQKKEFADWAMGKRQVNKEDKYYKRKYDKLMQEFSKKKVAELQKKYSAERRKNIEKIRKMVNELDRSVRRPDKNHYIPKYLVSSMLDVLRTIDLDSGYRKPDGSETLVYMKLKEMQKQYQEMQNDMDYAIASEYNETIDKAIGRLAEITKGRRLNELLDKDIADIVEIMEIITYQMRTARDLLENEKLSDIKEASQKAREQIKEAGRTFNTDAKLKNLFNRYLNNSLSPVRVMRRLEGYAHDGVLSSLGEELQQGERKTKSIRQKAYEMLDELYKDTKAIKALEKFRSEKLTYNIGGKNIVITPDMRAAIYLHSLNEQNMKHVVGNKTKEGSYRGGGIIIPNYQKQMKFNNRDSVKVNAAEKYTGQDAVRLSPSDVDRIIKNMTEYDKRIVELYQQVNEYLTKELNDTTMNLYGFKKATVKNYFPLIVDKSILNLDTDALKFDKTLESFGFLKERVNSAKPIYLEGVMDALERQIDQSSLFSGMAIPSRDFKKVWNYAAMDENDKFDNVNKQAQKAMGSYIDKYVGNLQADLAQARERGDASALLSAFGRGKMATGVLTGNLSVVLKQAASYPTAAGGVLGYRDLLAGLTPKGQRGKTLEKIMNKYTPLYQDRNTAAITGVNINDMNILKRRNPKIYYALTGWIESMDKATVRRLWYASENYVKRNFDYKVGSDDYYEEVAKVWEDTIRKTQPIYDTMNRPEYLRQTNELLKFLMMFKTQALQNVGIMVENYGELKARKRDYDKDKSDFNKKELVLAQRQFKKTVSSQIIQSLIFTGITALVDAFIKHRPQEWADEETGLITPESLRSSIIDAWTSNVIGQLAFGDIIRDLAYYPAKTLITGKEQNRFDLSVPPIEAMNTIINGINKGTNAVANNDIEKAKYYFKQVGETAAQYGFGLPVKNIENLYKGLEGNIKDIAAGKNPLEQSTDKQMYNRIYLAYQSGNPELAKELSEGYDEDKIKTKMVSKLKEEDTIKEAAEYRYKSELDKYQTIIDAYVSLGFDEDWVVSAINSVMNKTYDTTGSGEYNSNDLQRAIDISAVQGSKVAQQMYDEKYSTYKADGLKNDEAKKKALSSVRSAITGKYKSQYESGTTSQKVKIRDRLCGLRVAGERLYTYDSMKSWNK